MIKKYFVIGKQLYLQGKNLESYAELGKVVELEMPIEAYWEMDKFVAQANYLKASGESTPELLDFYKKIFKFSSNYAIYERDRSWLNERSKDSGKN